MSNTSRGLPLTSSRVQDILAGTIVLRPEIVSLMIHILDLAGSRGDVTVRC
jgi:hypothetical protein